MKINLQDLSKLIIFSIIYYLFTKESIAKIGLILALIALLVFLLDYFKKINYSFRFLLVTSFLLILPLTFSLEIKNYYLPTGYQYIYISIISSLIYLDSTKSEKGFSFFSKTIKSFIASLSPMTYLSGPSATFEELNKMNRKDIGLPSVKYLKYSNIKLALSGGMRLSLGLYFNTLDTNILNENFIFSDTYIFEKLILLIVWGFFNFWRYYLLFSGASELCKSFLSIFNINIIDNFNNPETAIFYHEIWNKWHLNITQRIRNFLYTPLTLFALRNFSYLNGFKKFILIEGIPVMILFFTLSLWHGGKINDLIFGFLSTIITLLSRFIYKNNLFRKNSEEKYFFREFFRFINLSLFGLILGIYNFKSGELKVDYFDMSSNRNIILTSFCLSFLAFIYYRCKLKILNFVELEQSKNNGIEISLNIFEGFIIIFINLFFLLDVEGVNDFIYFAN